MCGIAGFIHTGELAEADAAIRAMTGRLAHRGPDDSGVWRDPQGHCALGHRRLAIIDLTSEGHQPMVSACQRYVMVFNGEIYNYRDIRRDLESSGSAPHWRGSSDTEVLLAAVSAWGHWRTLERLCGMYAIALWDRDQRQLLLVRDRLGEKPLYYGWLGNTLAFASELKALRGHPSWRGQIDPDSLASLLRLGYVPGPRSIYRGVFKLPPATVLTVGATGSADERRYWSLSEAARQGIARPLALPAREISDELERLLLQTIGEQMIADVPIGAFLSGGVDSSTVVALMQAQSARPVRTFTVGFRESEYDEAPYARAVARHLGTDHTEVYVTARDALEVIPRLPELYDEPFADSSQIPTALISRVARQSVTVCLSGDGGDEVFGGYDRYVFAHSLWPKLRWLPRICRAGIGRAAGRVTASGWTRIRRTMGGLLPSQLRHATPGERMPKFAAAMAALDLDDLYSRLTTHWHDADKVVLGAGSDCRVPEEQEASALEQTERMMYFDARGYLPDDILVKLDRAAMSVSLETRVPLLSHKLVEFAWRIPVHMKIREGQGKWVMRQVLHRHVPRALVERPKKGFAVPIDAWLRGPLREWTEALLDEGRIRREGHLDPGPIRKKWREHLAGQASWPHHLWDVLMFQAWLERQKP